MYFCTERLATRIVSLAFAMHSNRGVYALLLGSGISRASGSSRVLRTCRARKLIGRDRECVWLKLAHHEAKTHRQNSAFSLAQSLPMGAVMRIAAVTFALLLGACSGAADGASEDDATFSNVPADGPDECVSNAPYEVCTTASGAAGARTCDVGEQGYVWSACHKTTCRPWQIMACPQGAQLSSSSTSCRLTDGEWRYNSMGWGLSRTALAAGGQRCLSRPPETGRARSWIWLPSGCRDSAPNSGMGRDRAEAIGILFRSRFQGDVGQSRVSQRASPRSTNGFNSRRLHPKLRNLLS